ncbi:DUF4268 domain-containing protein [Aquihabitans sp. G128]|nr:DUF4268 domain-containing protein [Aquihabitans sp. G128]
MELGDIEPVQPRSVWANEARDFTPWLLANAERLGRALGIELELHAAEHPVGGYSLDLIGQDLTNDAVLMVENQLEPTDHTHLGQVLTYAAGTGATTIVWIATAFRDEHRQALDWLNEQTGEDTHFFGVVLSLVRIGTSAPAPLFEVVSKPNDWQKRVRTASRSGGGMSPRSEKYRTFWERYLERQASEHSDWGRRGSPQPANWMSFGGPFQGTQINPSFAQGRRLRHELYIDRGDSSANVALFELLVERRELLEAAFGHQLEVRRDRRQASLPDRHLPRRRRHPRGGSVGSVPGLVPRRRRAHAPCACPSRRRREGLRFRSTVRLSPGRGFAWRAQRRGTKIDCRRTREAPEAGAGEEAS